MSFGAAQGLVATSVLPEVMPSPDLSDFAPNDPTKGDIFAGDGTNWDDLPVGTNGQVLQADSAETLGLKWTSLVLGSTTFLGLTDTPGTFVGQTLKVARVNAGETAVEFVGVTGTGSAVFDGSPTITTPTIASFANSAHDHADAAGGGQIPLTTGVTGVLPVANGGTALAVYVVGDILHATATTTIAGLAGVATGNAIISGGVGVVSSYGKIGLTTHVSGTLATGNGGTGVTGASTGSGGVVLDTSPTIVTPTIASFVNAGHSHTDAAGGGTLSAAAIASGTLAVARGGTGLATYAIGDLIIASAATTLISLADVATGNAVISGGVGVVPSYGKIGLTTHISGTLDVPNGGTGVTTSTGTGNTVLSASPTFTGTLNAAIISATGAITGVGSITSTSGSLRADGTSGTAVAFIDMDDGATVVAGAAGEVRMRSNAGVFEVSENGAAFAAPGGGGNTLTGAYNEGGAGAGRTLLADSDEVVITIDGGTIPTINSFKTALVLVNSSAAGDSVTMNMISGTSGSCTLGFGDSVQAELARVEFSNSLGSLTMSSGSSSAEIILDGTACIINTGSRNIDFQVKGDTLSHGIFLEADGASENLALLAASLPGWGGGDRIIFLGNAQTVPTTDPTAGGFLYAEAGALKWRGSSGFVTEIAIA